MLEAGGFVAPPGDAGFAGPEGGGVCDPSPVVSPGAAGLLGGFVAGGFAAGSFAGGLAVGSFAGGGELGSAVFLFGAGVDGEVEVGAGAGEGLVEGGEAGVAAGTAV